MTQKDTSTSLSGVVKGVAYRSLRRQPMVESRSCDVCVGQGLVQEDRPKSKRQITLLSQEKWADVCRELGEDLPWVTRRANILIEGADLSAAIGKKIHIGTVQILVHAETRPCELMEYLHKGLREAMKPQCRGGVFGEVLVDGTISIGDRFSVDAT